MVSFGPFFVFVQSLANVGRKKKSHRVFFSASNSENVKFYRWSGAQLILLPTVGIKIERDRKNGSISVIQAQYEENMLRKYNMCESHPGTTSLDINKNSLITNLLSNDHTEDL